MSNFQTLDYLEFDCSEDTDGVGTFDAMASTWPPQVSAVHAEIARVLDWAHSRFPDARGPIGEGGEWDYVLQGAQEWVAREVLHYDAHTRRITIQTGPPETPRHTVSFSISGTPAFCEAFRLEFGLD
jgi:hypothetical protein